MRAHVRRSALLTFLVWAAPVVTTLGQAQYGAIATARRQANAKTAQIIQDELKEHGGDWEAWYKELAPFREALRPQTVEIRPAPRADMIPNGILRTTSGPPLFSPTNTNAYIFAEDRSTLAEYVQSRPSVPVAIAFAKWLRAAGIDLILVPAPKMAEVYPDRLVGTGVPADRIVAPHMRQLLLDLIDADIEVVDLLPAFLDEAKKPGEQLYLPADTHWSNRAQQIAANILTQRLRRYPFVQQAMAKPSAYQAKDVSKRFEGYIYGYLNEREKAAIEPSLTTNATVTYLKGIPFQEPEIAPVLVMGDSFTHYYNYEIQKGSGIDALLTKSINMPVSNISIASGATQPIRDFLRDPDQRKYTRVILWIVTSDLLVGNWDKLWTPVTFPKL